MTLARRADGAFVPLDEQDPSGWDEDLIAEGESYLRRARSAAPPGRFQLEAAIQAVHCERRRTGATSWASLRTLYAALLATAPTLGAQVASAVVTGRIDGPDAGLADLPTAVDDFQPYWAARADLLARAGRDATEAYRRAADLATDPAVAGFLRRRGAARTGTGPPSRRGTEHT